MNDDRKSTIFLVLMFFVGLSLLLYPSLANWWNDQVQSSLVMDYNKLLKEMDSGAYNKAFRLAEEYNQRLDSLELPIADYDQLPEYWDLLDITGNGIIGTLRIDRLRLELPIFHGTSDSVLNVAVGHLQGTSLPVGGVGTHAVLSAHRGLPSAKLFTDLDKMKVGDPFVIKVLNRTLTYEVDLISIVEPDQIEIAATVPGKDYVSLMTCTPYGINSHRMFVRGHRIDTVDSSTPVVRNEAYELDSLMLAPIFAAPMLLILLIALFVSTGKKERSVKPCGKDHTESAS